MRVLWSLPKAAPAILRHIAAYAELLACDLEQARKDAVAGVVVTVVLVVAVFFAVLMGCLAVVAVTWDTPNRLTAIAWMGGGFVALVVATAVYRGQAASSRGPLLATLRREWVKDSAIVERILADDQS